MSNNKQQIKDFLEYDCFMGVQVIKSNGEKIITDSKWVQANIDFNTYNYIHIAIDYILLNYVNGDIIELIAL